MRLGELKTVKDTLQFPILLCTNRLRFGECHGEEEVERTVWELARAVTIEADLTDHIRALEDVLQICTAVAKGRYLEDWQRCNWGPFTCQYACTSGDRCELFDTQDAHTAIADKLAQLPPFREEVKAWMTSLAPSHREPREGGPPLVGDGRAFDSAEQRWLSAEEAAARRAEGDATQAHAYASLVLRMDQYELNLQRIRHICEQRGDLREVASLIQDGLPPAIRQPISPN